MKRIHRIHHLWNTPPQAIAWLTSWWQSTLTHCLGYYIKGNNSLRLSELFVMLIGYDFIQLPAPLHTNLKRQQFEMPTEYESHIPLYVLWVLETLVCTAVNRTCILELGKKTAIEYVRPCQWQSADTTVPWTNIPEIIDLLGRSLLASHRSLLAFASNTNEMQALLAEPYMYIQPGIDVPSKWRVSQITILAEHPQGQKSASCAQSYQQKVVPPLSSDTAPKIAEAVWSLKGLEADNQ